MTKRAKPFSPTAGLADLAGLRKALSEHQREQAAQVELARQRQRREQTEGELFRHEVGPVRRLPAHSTAASTRARPQPHPLQRELDERSVMREALSDDVDIESLLLTDDGLSFRKPGIAADVVSRLRRGQWALQDQIDLHGHNRDQARDALVIFLRQARQRGLRCVRVVHGKGNGSPGREPVLKGRVQRWLAQRAEVIAFAQASGPQGGAGALIVLLGPG